MIVGFCLWSTAALLDAARIPSRMPQRRPACPEMKPLLIGSPDRNRAGKAVQQSECYSTRYASEDGWRCSGNEGSAMNDVASGGADISRIILEASGETLGAALLVFGRDDTITFASTSILQFFPVPAGMLVPGTRLRDFLGAVYDTGVRPGTLPESSRHRPNREDWIAEQMALHWRERYENVERAGRTRWLSLRQRRLSSGIGLLAVSDVSEQKKRDEQARTDLQRIALTEEILNAQPNPICVKDRNLHYIAVNKAFSAIHDLAPDAMLGRSASDLVETELAEHFERSDRHVLETGTPYSEAEHIVRADGSDLWVVTRKYRVGLPDRHFVVTCMNDVTDIAVWYGGSEKGGDTGLQIRDYSIFTPAQNFYDPFRSLDMQQLASAGSKIGMLPARGLRVLLATADREMEERFVARLRGSGLDACAVRNGEELDAFALAAEARGLRSTFFCSTPLFRRSMASSPPGAPAHGSRYRAIRMRRSCLRRSSASVPAARVLRCCSPNGGLRSTAIRCPRRMRRRWKSSSRRTTRSTSSSSRRFWRGSGSPTGSPRMEEKRWTSGTNSSPPWS